MVEIEEVIEILKGLQAIDGEYDHHREGELYKAIRLLEVCQEKQVCTRNDVSTQ